jgi:predicted enzyme related to lactoylglutathione lyase
MILGLRTVIYKVPDLARAKAWYSKAFGVKPYFDEPFYVGFSIGGFELGLDPDMTGVSPGAGGVVPYWGVADIEAAVQDFTKTGATIKVPVTDVGGDIRVATVVDPFGNLVGLIQNPHFVFAEKKSKPAGKKGRG